jgi:hypothetical protein
MKENRRVLRRAGRSGLAAALVAGMLAAPGLAAPFDYIILASPPSATYQVTLTNLTAGQPFSPPVAATHRPGLHMFQVGQLATDELAAIAQDGNEMPMFNRFHASPLVSQAVDIGRPLTPFGKTVGAFTDSATFMIHARPGDRFSLATMLICTNDGFLGLDAVELPRSGAATFMLNGYDAGRENNTEKSVDIVDPCSALGPERIGTDPDGNRDAEVATNPPEPIHLHPGITGAGDLSPRLHGWTNPVAMVTIQRLN